VNLSKSTYVRGIQCCKILWLEKNRPEEQEITTDSARLAVGNEVGDLARGYFGPYVKVRYDPSDYAGMAKQTKQWMDEGQSVICEATFIHDGDICLVDILRRDGDGWQIIEVKSASGGAVTKRAASEVDELGETVVKAVYLDDVAFQYRVLSAAGVQVTDTFLMHLNNEYVRGEDLDIQQLFLLENCTRDVIARQQEIEKNIADIKAVASGSDEPTIGIGPHCSDPYPCAFKRHCWGDLLERQTVFDIYKLGDKAKFAAYDAGVVSFEQIRQGSYLLPSGRSLNDKQRVQIDLELDGGGPLIDEELIASFLTTVRYPLYYLDFETYAEAIPPYPGLRPYQQIPFQYSLHIQQAPHAEPTHKEFLAQEGSDPRYELARQLCQDIPTHVCVVAYNDTFEKSRLSELTYQFPALADHLISIRDNMVDLLVPFQQHAFYDRNQHGGKSIKQVLPAMFPDDSSMNYANLEGIHNGGDASSAFPALATMTEEEKAKTRHELLEYCGLDTLAMVKIMDRLHELKAR